MTEIEKMYENIGIEKKRYCEFEDECPYNFGHCCKDCDIELIQDKYSYPPFTVEKQLEIIKLISKQGQVIIENWEKDNRGFNVTFRANSNLRYITMDCITRKTVKEALAQIINDIWQDLTDQEKEEIRNILNA